MRPTSLPKNFCPVSSFLFSGHWAAEKNRLSLVFAAAVIGEVLPVVTVGGDGVGGAKASPDNLAGNSPASSNSDGGADEVLSDITRQ